MVITRFSPYMRKIKIETMKKILIFLILAGILAGCYPEFRNDFTYTTVAFSPVTGGLTTSGELGRSVVKDEGLKLDVGVYLAGVLENKSERWVKFSIDPSLLAGTSYTLLPADYYTLSNTSKFVIPSGSFIGKITVKLDSTKFLNDRKAVGYNYAIPLRLTESSADSILSIQNTKILVVKYINHFEGFYDNTGSFKTYDVTGKQINAGSISNVIEAKTVFIDTVLTNGVTNMTGLDNLMKVVVRPDKSVYYKKLPNQPKDLTPKNIAPIASLVSTSYVSSWEKLEAIRDGYNPTSSSDKTGGAYGNWNSANIERWVQYDFAQAYKLSQSDVYWWTDGGGILFPNYCKLEYWDLATQAFLPVPNPVGLGVLGNQYNITTFDNIITTKIRMSFKNSVQSVGILEWKLWGVSVPVTLEQAPILNVIPQGANTYDEVTDTYTLNYKVTYEALDYYTIVSTSMKWRNRIRDKVNEWRR
jgi:hypothetical protein